MGAEDEFYAEGSSGKQLPPGPGTYLRPTHPEVRLLASGKAFPRVRELEERP